MEGRAGRRRCGTTGWRPVNGETVYLRYDTGDPKEIALVRPEDQEPGSMMTVFPFRESERGQRGGPAATASAGRTTRPC